MKATLTLITTLLLAPLATLAAQDAPLARPATIPRARVAETSEKQFLTNLKTNLTLLIALRLTASPFASTPSCERPSH